MINNVLKPTFENELIVIFMFTKNVYSPLLLQIHNTAVAFDFQFFLIPSLLDFFTNHSKLLLSSRVYILESESSINESNSLIKK